VRRLHPPLGFVVKVAEMRDKDQGLSDWLHDQTGFKDQIQKEWKLPNGHWKLLKLFWEISEKDLELRWVSRHSNWVREEDVW
jgi:hypothetical protein